MRRARWGFGGGAGLPATMIVILAAGFGGPSAARAQAKKADDVQPVTFETDDGFSLKGTYYKSSKEEEAPVVVLLHMKDENRFVWQNGKNEPGGFAKKLQSEGYAVITVDLRLHGESKGGGPAPPANANQGGGKPKGKKVAGLNLKPEEYTAMWEYDMEAVKDFIYKEHQAKNLNMNKMGIVGPEMGAAVAAYFADYDWNKEPYDDGQPGFETPRGQDVRALVFISPEEKTPTILAFAKVMPDLKDPAKGIAILVCSGSDAKEKKEAEKVFEMTAPKVNKDRMYFKAYSAKLKGTNLLDQKLGIEDYMLVFFDKHLKSLDSPWRDRESKRNRKAKK